MRYIASISYGKDSLAMLDFEKRFQMEDAGLVPIGKGFRWSMLEDPPPEQIKFF